MKSSRKDREKPLHDAVARGARQRVWALLYSQEKPLQADFCLDFVTVSDYHHIFS